MAVENVFPQSTKADSICDYTQSRSESELLKIDQVFREIEAHPSRPAKFFLDKYPQFENEIHQHLQILELFESKEPEVYPSDSIVIDLPTQIGKYQLVEELGRGGMGAVFRALRKDIKTEFAVKIINKRLSKYTDDFKSEAATISQFHHQNVVPFVDFGEFGDFVYLVMRKIDGTTLSNAIPELRRIGGLSSNRWQYYASLMLPIANALNYVHDRGVVHRDIKPLNILIDEETVFWLTDFGLSAKVDDHSCRFGGTVRYMAPEQVRGVIDYRSDIYSFGVTFFELCTGIKLGSSEFFERTDNAQFITRNALKRIDGEMPDDIVEIICTCCDILPRLRYANAAELVSALQESTMISSRLVKRINRKRYCMIGLAAIAFVVFSTMIAGVLKTPKKEKSASDVEARLTSANHSVTRPLAKNSLPIFPSHARSIRNRLIACRGWNSVPLIGLQATDAESDPIEYSVKDVDDGSAFYFDNILRQLCVLPGAKISNDYANVSIEAHDRRRLAGVYLTREDGRLYLHDLGDRLKSPADSFELPVDGRLVDIACDGKQLYRLLAVGERMVLQAASVSLSKRSIEVGEFETISNNCGLPVSTVAMETTDGESFCVFFRSDHQGSAWDNWSYRRFKLYDRGIFKKSSPLARVSVAGNIECVSLSSQNSLAIQSSSSDGEASLYSMPLNAVSLGGCIPSRHTPGNPYVIGRTCWLVDRPTVSCNSIDLEIKFVPIERWPAPVEFRAAGQEKAIRIENDSSSRLTVFMRESVGGWHEHETKQIDLQPGGVTDLTTDRSSQIEVYDEVGLLWDAFSIETVGGTRIIAGPIDFSVDVMAHRMSIGAIWEKVTSSVPGDQTIDAVKELTRQYPNVAGIHAMLGYAELMRKNYTPARAAYLRASRLAPSDASHLLHLSEISRLEGDTAVAARYLSRVLKNHPNNRLALLGKIRLAIANEDFGQSYRLAKDLYRDHPEDPLVIACTAWTYRLVDKTKVHKQIAEACFKFHLRNKSNTTPRSVITRLCFGPYDAERRNFLVDVRECLPRLNH